ncbi:MAG: alpha/beta hydrolase, partial [Bacteroidota bacterium]
MRSDVPFYLMGHSMGGLVVSDWWSSGDRDGIDGLILSSAALKVPPPNPLLLAVAPFISKWLPRLSVGSLDPSLLSRDPAVGERYIEDPLTTTSGVQARTGMELLQ